MVPQWKNDLWFAGNQQEDKRHLQLCESLRLAPDIWKLKAPETRASGQDISQQQQTTAPRIRNHLSQEPLTPCVIKLANAPLDWCDCGS